MLDQIEADYFDAKTPLKQLANITITDASTISLNVWDKTAIKSIEKAITEFQSMIITRNKWNDNPY